VAAVGARSKEEMAAELARISEMTRLASLQQASMTPQALQLSRHARRVYVGNLPQNTTESSLTHYFNQVQHSSSCIGCGQMYVFACISDCHLCNNPLVSVWYFAQLCSWADLFCFWACQRQAR
jgi:RNA recognition motif-containing protein